MEETDRGAVPALNLCGERAPRTLLGGEEGSEKLHTSSWSLSKRYRSVG